jgi:prevent-host-death family protein
MKHVEIGAFEAKTHFSQLLHQVEQGTIIHITRRGEPVAVLMGEKTDRQAAGKIAVDRIRGRRNEISKRSSTSIEELLSFRDAGRK